MAFSPATDYFTLSGGGLILAASTENKTAQNVTAMDECGDIVAHEEFGFAIAPQCTYKIKGNVSKSIVLGGDTTTDGHRVALGNVTIGTTAGGEPTFTASGTEIEPSSEVSGCTYTVSLSGLSPLRHAQILFGACNTLTASGCYLNGATYTIQATVGVTTVDGEPKASDTYEGQIQAQLEIIQTDTTEPSMSRGTGWEHIQPLTYTRNDGAYKVWTTTLVKYLTKDA